MWIKIIKRTTMVIVMLLLILTAATWFFMRQAQFGAVPSGERLLRMEASKNFKNGQFQNKSETPTFAKGYGFFSELYKQFFKTNAHRFPIDAIPSVKIDLKNLTTDAEVLIWFGHSSFFIQTEGKKILVDPVFSSNASPIPGSVKAFKGSDIYTAADLPEIDYVLISHDHYDHLDYETMLTLKNKTKKVICGLGVGAHLERWGYLPGQIVENDWDESLSIAPGFTIHTLPARHKSGRGFAQNNTLWLSFILKSPKRTVYYSGDSGYDQHFAEIGKAYGPIDLAIMENGQYDPAWHYVHNLPDEVLKATQDLKAKRLLPVHSSKFVLAKHSWDEPLAELTRRNGAYHFPLLTPIIGEMVNLNDTNQQFKQWWVGLE